MQRKCSHNNRNGNGRSFFPAKACVLKPESISVHHWPLGWSNFSFRDLCPLDGRLDLGKWGLHGILNPNHFHLYIPTSAKTKESEQNVADPTMFACREKSYIYLAVFELNLPTYMWWQLSVRVFLLRSKCYAWHWWTSPDLAYHTGRERNFTSSVAHWQSSSRSHTSRSASAEKMILMISVFKNITDRGG